MSLSIEKPAFTVKGLNLPRVIAVIGLGNPGREYERTRHNLGFEVIDQALESLNENLEFKENKKLEALVKEVNIDGNRVFFIKPTTFMNLSGKTVSNLVRYYPIKLNDILVVHDDLDLIAGKLKLSTGQSSAGHNGVESINNTIGADYYRLRVGIGPRPDGADQSDFVLSKFKPEEREVLLDVTQQAATKIIDFLKN